MPVTPKKDYSQQTEAVIVDNEEKIVDLLEETLKLTRENSLMIRKINRWILFQKIKGWFYLALVVLPIAVAIFYLPPLLDQWINQYQKIWQMISGLRNQTVVVPESNSTFSFSTLDQRQIENFCQKYNQ